MIYYIDEINDKNIYLYSRYRQYYTIIKRLKNYKIWTGLFEISLYVTHFIFFTAECE